ncbi:MAG: translation initiation factor IF-2, partial [Candidatus Omnitrophota bacterium]|nr:translation initiation factor IF-2 [Candidatus Omnitrophota bacterium]
MIKKAKEDTKKEKKPAKAKTVKAKPKVKTPPAEKPKRVAVKKEKAKEQVAPPKPKEEIKVSPVEIKPEPKKEAPAPKPEVPIVPAPPAPVAPAVTEKKEPVKLTVKMPIMVKDLAAKLNAKPNDIIVKLMKRKIMATINQALDLDVANIIAVDYGYELERPPTPEEEMLKSLEVEDKTKLVARAPVVTLMGHVDHGKTSLLDAIRKSSLTEKESGGITQHIGAYEVAIGKGHVTFLDTPGHEAFTAMRARGAQVTDIVILVVAVDDGVMPQTLEAIDHARAAGVPIVVALNKIDKPEADPDKVKKQLLQAGLMPEDWGGKTITLGVSAKTGKGIDELLEMLLLESDMLQLKADPTRTAKGVVIEGKLSKGGGPIATVLVQSGTLRPGDIVIAGSHIGKVRAMINDLGHRINEAPPSKPVEILGLDGVPQAGDQFFVITDEKLAKDIVARRQQEVKAKEMQPVKRITLEDLSQQVKEGKAKELKLIVKGDVQGSVEALVSSLKGLETQDIKLDIVHSGATSINDSDVMLAVASNAIIIGFRVELTPEAETKAKLESVDVRLYKIIYEAIADVRSAMEGLLEPRVEEIFLGRAEVRQVFKVTKAGTIAGCFVVKGKITRGAVCRLIRGKDKIYEGKIGSLKRFKD